MAQNLDLKTLSVVELKALAYDLQMLAAQTQQNLQIVLQEIKARPQAPLIENNIIPQSV